MIVQVNFGDVQHSDAVVRHTEERLAAHLAHNAERITRIEVHLRDDNAGKPGPNDKRCTMEYRIAGWKPGVVEHTGDDFYKVIDEAAGKLARAVSSALGKAEARR